MNDYKKDKNIDDLNSILILNDAYYQSSTNKLDNELLKINNLIKKKYILDKKKEDLIDNRPEKNLFDIKKSKDQINDNVKKQTLKVTGLIEYQKKDLKKLYDEEILFDQNKIQLDIIHNQQQLINNYKKNNDQLKLNYNNLEKELGENVKLNRESLINNNELKNTISRFVVHNKNLQNNINQLKKNFETTSLDVLKKNEMTLQIKFYQDENTRLSSEIINIQKNYETIKNNLTTVENEKNIIYKKIKELDRSLITSNIIGSPFPRETVIEDSINAKTLNDINDVNLNDKKNKSEQNSNLDDQIDNIFR